MYQPLKKLALILSFCLYWPCSALTLETDIPPGPKWDAFDATTESPSQMPMDRMIIATVSSKWHQSLIDGRSVKEEPLPKKYHTFLKEIEKKYGLKRTADWPLHAINEHCFVFTAESNAHRNEAVRQMKTDDRFNKITKMTKFSTMGDTGNKKNKPASPSSSIPYNDPYFNLQFSFDRLNLNPLHQQTHGEGILIAVIDTGLDIHHQEMKGRIKGTKNVVDKEDHIFLKDLHGTAVSSIIAANANNNAGMVGIAPKANLLGIKACWEDNPENHGAVCSSFNIIKAMDFALKQKAHIINLSLAGPNDEILEALISQAEQQGTLIIGSVDPNQIKSFPTLHPQVIAVAHPKAFKPGTRVDVLAPGKKIFSALPNNEYEFFTGNSFSTAHISGVLALIKSQLPDLNLFDLRKILKQTASSDKMLNTCDLLKALPSAPSC